jgi:hypothetical protein
MDCFNETPLSISFEIKAVIIWESVYDS